MRAKARAVRHRFSALAQQLLRVGRRLRPAPDRRRSVADAHTGDTRLGRALLAASAFHAGESGVMPLLDGHDAFAARVLLADAAERTLDVQYYIWRGDTSGTLLMQALHRAADRGVRVRLLLDDNNTTDLDELLAALDAHPNVEVRLFNPFRNRRWRALGYLVDFSRLNRRMHNKSFTADNQVTIVGGRNVGDEYFDADAELAFVDLDVLVVGAVVPEVSTDFDRYWDCASSHPLPGLVPPAPPGAAAWMERHTGRVAAGEAGRRYLQALVVSPLVSRLLDGELTLEWAGARLISDDPAKGLGRAAESTLLPQRMVEALGEPARELMLVSAYFVPTRAGVAMLAQQARRGVKVSVLTNALEATDVLPVHAGYEKYRRPLLAAGVRLHEMKRSAAPASGRDRGLTGNSASSLHAKIFAVDRRRAFVGSFNFDPRSARLNTEMGLVLDCPALAGRLATLFEESLAQAAYEVRLAPGGRSLQWLEHGADGIPRLHRHEPGAGLWTRLAVWCLARLPIEPLL